MEFRKIVSIIQMGVLEKVENQLKKIGVPGISVTKVKGYGEYANFYSPDWKNVHARIEIYTTAAKADEIIETVTNAAHTGLARDGIIVVTPVEQVYRIKTKRAISEDEL